MHELKELQQRRDAVRLLVLRGAVRAHLLRRALEARADVPLAERLQQQHEDLLERVVHAVPVLPRVPRERLAALQRLAVRVDQLQRGVEREE